VVVVWLRAGGWVVCVCVWCWGGWGYVAQIDSSLLSHKAVRALQAAGQIFALKQHNEKESYRQQVIYLRYMLYPTISDYIRLYLYPTIPSWDPTISHRIKTGISKRYTSEGGYPNYLNRLNFFLFVTIICYNIYVITI